LFANSSILSLTVVQSSYKSRLFKWLLVKFAIITFCILFSGILLGPDEAQYWTWSQSLDWGYYSKPPGIAWQIWAGTTIFGQNEWGVRALSVLFGLFQSFFVYELALKSGLSPRASFWSGLWMALCPLGLIGSFLAITDVGFLLCWTGACLFFVHSLQKKEEVNLLAIGAWIALGALFKWPIYVFWIFTLLFFKFLKKKTILPGLFISLLGLLPSLIWNIEHDWATFRHVLATVEGGHGEKAGNFFSFFGSQCVLVSLPLFILLLASFAPWLKNRNRLEPSLQFCGYVTFGSLGVALFLSCFQKIQGNWAAFAYPTSFIVMSWMLFDQKEKWFPRVQWGFAIFTAIPLLFVAIAIGANTCKAHIPHQWNPLKHNQGWPALSKVLSRHGYDEKKHYLVSDKYQTTSLLSFYAQGQNRAYFLNLQNMRKNQFSYWPSVYTEQKGRTGYFVWVENSPRLMQDYPEKMIFYQRELEKLFEKVEFLELAPLLQQGTNVVKGALLFRCENCVREEVESIPKY
jgi:Dolichyl-phosphate-mannose-protein mannosyltransferase